MSLVISLEKLLRVVRLLDGFSYADSIRIVSLIRSVEASFVKLIQEGILRMA